MTAPANLTDRAVLCVSGPEAEPFLQGLITNDVRKVADGSPLYGALLTPQGKILFDFLIVQRDGAYLFDCAEETAGMLQKRLQLYRLRSKVTIDSRSDLAVMAGWDATLPAQGFIDPRNEKLGWRAILARNDLPQATARAEAYLSHRLDCGVPESADFGQDRIFALDAGLEELNGVSFDKGCYVGQELTARMKHRGTARKRLLAVSTGDGSDLPEHDDLLTADAQEIGALVSRYGHRGFALVRLDRLADAAGSVVTIAGTPIRVSPPPLSA